MKKFKIFYFIVIAFSILMIFTKGFEPTTVIREYSDGIVPDGMYTKTTLSIFNCIIIASIMVFTLLTTHTKKNTTNKKWIYFTIIFLLLLFIPLGTNYSSGGIAGNLGGEKYFYLWSLFI